MRREERDATTGLCVEVVTCDRCAHEKRGKVEGATSLGSNRVSFRASPAPVDAWVVMARLGELTCGASLTMELHFCPSCLPAVMQAVRGR